MLLDGFYHLLLASAFIVIFDRPLHMSGEAVPWLTLPSILPSMALLIGLQAANYNSFLFCISLKQLKLIFTRHCIDSVQQITKLKNYHPLVLDQKHHTKWTLFEPKAYHVH